MAPLVLHVVWNPDSTDRGETIAQHLYSLYVRRLGDPLARGIGIPTYWWSDVPGEEALDRADPECLAVVLLVDESMLLSERWRDGRIRELCAEIERRVQRGRPARLFPVALSHAAFGLDRTLGETNFIRLWTPATPEEQAKGLVEPLTHELCRLLMGDGRVNHATPADTPALHQPRVRLFLSHAKRDGTEVAHTIRDYLHRVSSSLELFFDVRDIAPGTKFAAELEAGVKLSTLLVLFTDAYSHSTWCNQELVWAKQHGRPVVVVDCLQDFVSRSSPFCGNVPTLRWDFKVNDPGRPVEATLLETLRALFNEREMRALVPEETRSSKTRILSRPPDLLDLIHLLPPIAPDTPELLLYPDPPLSDLEAALLRRVSPDVRLTTPVHHLLRAARRGQDDRPLANLWIALSVSDDIEDQRRLGIPTISKKSTVGGYVMLEQGAVQDVFVSLARQLMSEGAQLAYGGDLRKSGYSDVLFDLVAAYNKESREPASTNWSYLAWPVHHTLTNEVRLKRLNDATFVEVPAPDGVDRSLPRAELDPPPTTARALAAWSRCLTAMRRRMAQDTHARVLLGGRTKGYLGRYPGLVEEALVTLEEKRPLFLLGGFGGCGRVLAEAILDKETPRELTWEGQRGHDPLYEEALALLATAPPKDRADYPGLVSYLHSLGWEGLRNGLDEGETRRLAWTTHLREALTLVLLGLSRVARASS